MKPVIQHCDTMADVRRHIDAIDARIVPLIAERTGYVAQAARIKDDPSKVLDVPRVEAVVAKALAVAREHGAPESVVEATYRAMVAAFIEFEHQEFARLRKGTTP